LTFNRQKLIHETKKRGWGEQKRARDSGHLVCGFVQGARRNLFGGIDARRHDMFLARVLGSIVSTIKHPDYNSTKLMIVQPITPDGENDGASAVAVDSVGVGKGETVLVLRLGAAAALVLNVTLPAVRSVIVGVVDHIEITNAEPDPRVATHEAKKVNAA
jgi:ethanolamine utilization protein EutN